MARFSQLACNMRADESGSAGNETLIGPRRINPPNLLAQFATDILITNLRKAQSDGR